VGDSGWLNMPDSDWLRTGRLLTPGSEEQLSRRALLRDERSDPARVEEAVSILLADAGAARRGRLLL
jgi:hypothetical protein